MTANADTAPAGRKGWLRALEAAPLGPLWLGAGFWVAFMIGWAAWCALFGELGAHLDPSRPLGLGPSARIQIVLGGLIAFMLASRRQQFRAVAAGSWQPIQPLTDLAPEPFRAYVEAELLRSDRRRPVLDVSGALLGVCVVFLSSGDGELHSTAAWDSNFVWALVATATVFRMMARAAYTSLQGRTYERIADRIQAIDLLDTRPLSCFGRNGLRLAFHWVGGSCIASLLAWNLDRVGPLIAILAITLALASTALLKPVRVVRRRIVEAKRNELERVHGGIRSAREKLWAGDAAPELPALLGYEQRVAEVREWPFDASTLLRFGALSLVATGSWFGGAVVERVLDRLLS